ncbi:MAG: hypothetical protein WD533_07505 [Dehalococcoidia bacterium]
MTREATLAKYRLAMALLLPTALLVLAACGAVVEAEEGIPIRADDEDAQQFHDGPVWNGHGSRVPADTLVVLPRGERLPVAPAGVNGESGGAASPSPTPPVVWYGAPVSTPMPALCAETAGTSVTVQGKEIPLHESLCISERDEGAGVVRIQVMAGRSFVALETATGRRTAGMMDWAEVDLFEHFEPLVGPLPRSTPAPISSPVAPKESPRP